MPDVAMDGSGNAVAVWEQFDGSLNNILANRYSGAWIAAGLIETGNAGLAANARVAVNAGGRAVAVWEQYDGTRMSIYANRYN